MFLFIHVLICVATLALSLIPIVAVGFILKYAAPEFVKGEYFVYAIVGVALLSSFVIWHLLESYLLPKNN